jgi:hypothetical protein
MERNASTSKLLSMLSRSITVTLASEQITELSKGPEVVSSRFQLWNTLFQIWNVESEAVSSLEVVFSLTLINMTCVFSIFPIDLTGLLWVISLLIVKLFLGNLLNRSFWVKPWLLLWLFKSEDSSSYNILIKLTRAMFLLESFHRSYWVNLKTFGLIMKNCSDYLLYCDRYDFNEFAHFSINCVSWLYYFSYVDILFVTTKLIWKCFRDYLTDRNSTFLGQCGKLNHVHFYGRCLVPSKFRLAFLILKPFWVATMLSFHQSLFLYY